MLQIPQSTSRVVRFKMYLTGTSTEATGKTVTVTIAKTSGTFANPSAGATTATEDANGSYYFTLSTTDTNTVGDLEVRATASGCDACTRMLAVVKATTGGLTALPDAAAGANAGLPVLSVSGTTLGYTVTTLTTYTGNTPQTGDSFARIGGTGSGLTSLAPSSTALSTAQWTNARAGYLDNLSAAPPTVSQIWTTALTESYAADGAAFTAAQALFMLWSLQAELSLSGTTMTAKKLDGSTSAMTFTLNDTANPTGKTRAS